MTTGFNLHDPYADTRLRMFGAQRFAYVYGTDERRQTKDLEAQPLGNDILRLNSLRAPITRLLVEPNYLRKDAKHRLDDYDCIINGITNSDSHPKVLAAVTTMLKGFKGRVINDPSRVARTGRDAVARALRDVPGLVVPGVARFRASASPKVIAKIIADARVTYPAIMRFAGSHFGSGTARVNSLDSVIANLPHAPAFYLISYVDLQGSDGNYRKHRFFFIGDDIVYRHKYVSDHWNVQPDARDRFMVARPDLIDEERRAINAGLAGLPAGALDTLKAIQARIGLDYFGIDCGFRGDGRMVLFETNASMFFYHPSLEDPLYEYLRRPLDEGRAAFNRMLAADYVPRAKRQPAR